MTNLDVLPTLRACPLFQDFPEHATEALVAYLDVLNGNAGDVLFEQGAPGSGLHVVARGRVCRRVRDAEGVERNIGELSAPASLGEVSLLLRGERFVTVHAVTDVTVLELSHASFRLMRQENPDLCLLLVMAIVRRLGHVLDGSRDVLHRVLLRHLAGTDVG